MEGECQEATGTVWGTVFLKMFLPIFFRVFVGFLGFFMIDFRTTLPFILLFL